jgi:outer membrane protein TolC
MSTRLKFLTLTAFAAMNLGSVAQDQYSLEAAKKMAVENNADVKLQQIEILKAEKNIWEVKAIGLPQINAEAGFQHFIDIPTSVLPANAFNPFAPEDELIGVQFGTEYTMTANLTVSQLLFDGRYLVGIQAIKMFKQVQDVSLVKTEKIAKEEVESAYYMVVAAAEQVKIIEQTKRKLQKLKDDIQILADEQVLEQTEADQMALNLQKLENNLTLAKKQHELATDLLKLKMGFGIGENIAVTDSLWTLVSSLNADSYMNKEFNAGATLDVQMLETQLLLDGLNIKNEKAAGIPSLAAFFQTQQQAFRNEFDFFQNKPWYPANIWGVNLSVPIFSSGQRAAKVRQAEFVEEQTEIRIGSVKEGLELQVKNAKVNLQSALDILSANEKSVELADRILASARIKFKEGVISSTEFTQAENQYITTQSEYINSAFQLLNSKLELDKIISNE